MHWSSYLKAREYGSLMEKLASLLRVSKRNPTEVSLKKILSNSLNRSFTKSYAEASITKVMM